MSARTTAARVPGGAAQSARRPAATAPALPQALLAGAIALALTGFGVATYLAVTHLGDQPIACNGVGDCNYVNSSEYAKVVGVPVSLLGAGAYATIAALTLLAWRARSFEMLLAAWGVALASFVFSAYLTWIELQVLEAICIYCVASAVIITALFAVLTVTSFRLRDVW